MKKLLSICFLSIFLLMFGMQAQAQIDCCFQLSNPSADTLDDIANMPNGLPLTHSLDVPSYGATDVYDLVFSDANCLGIDYNTGKVSIELELWCDGENILDGEHDLSRYCNITLQTFYEELHWVGTPMLGENYPYAFEYPGAVPIFPGTYQISNIAFDYFYFKFLVNSKTRLVVTWNQVFRDVKLIVHIRERMHGTDNSLYWNSHVEEGEGYQLGGHQSHPGAILASDTLTTDPYIQKYDTIKDCEPVTVGMPEYTMDTTGNYNIAYVDTTCGYRIDSIVHYNYTHYVHPTTPAIDTLRYCQKGEATPIVLPDEPNDTLSDHVADIVPYWYFAAEDSFYYAASFTPETDTLAGFYHYYVKRHDNITLCESEIDTFVVQILPNPSDPQIDTLIEYCVGDSAVALTYPGLPAGQRVLWGLSATAITDTIAPVPVTTAADTTIYYLKLQDTTTVNKCESDGYDSIFVMVYANPTVAITIDEDTLCFGETASMVADPTTLSTYQWMMNDVDVADSTNTTFSYTNDVTVEDSVKFTLKVSQAYVNISCYAKDSVYVLAYPEIGAPTPAFTDTIICGAKEITFKVTPGANGTSAMWYAADTLTPLVTTADTMYTATFEKTDTIFVSSVNDFGCETPKDQWVRIIVTVDTIPAITLTPDTSVCAGSDLVLHSTVVSSYSFTYAWSGTGLVAPLDEDSVIFNYTISGTYTDTLTVTDINGCSNMDTVKVTVDTLPVITLNVNYTIQDDNYCVGHNGEIIFTTPQYVNYSIDSGSTWQAYPDTAFLALPFGEYHLIVEDGNGCKNNPATTDTIKDTRATIVPYLSMVPNTHCDEPYSGMIILDSIRPESTDYHYRYTKEGATDTSAYVFATTDTLFTGLVHGKYTVIAEDTTTGCVGSDTIRITVTEILPTASITAKREICYGDTNQVTLVGGDTSVIFDSWVYSGPVPQNDTLVTKILGLQSFNLLGFPAGTHVFTANFHDSITHCPNTVSDTLRVIDVNIDLITIPYDAHVCEYDSLKIFCRYFPDNPAEDTIITYAWYAREYRYVASDVYDTVWVSPSYENRRVSIVAYDNHGCSSSKYTDLNVWPLPELTINVDAQNYCQNEISNIVVIASSTPDYHYAWKQGGNPVGTDNMTLAINVGMVDTNVTLTVTDGNGCVNYDTVSINVIEIPGKPFYADDSLYFCDNDVRVDTFQQPTVIGDYYWVGDNNPNVVAATGTYTGYFVNTENMKSCYSDTAKVYVEVTGAPRFNLAIYYNNETTSDTVHSRCYDPSAGDTLHFVVDPAPSATLEYVYEVNSNDTTNTFILSDTLPGTYTYTIHISDTARHSDGTDCHWDTTVTYKFTINALPSAPTNFPNAYETTGDSTIFYCQSSTPTYTFTVASTNDSLSYYEGSVLLAAQPDTAGSYMLRVTDKLTGCENEFPFKIAEIPTPTDTVFHVAKNNNCEDDVINDTIVARITNTDYLATYIRFFVWNPGDSVAKTINEDTLFHQFSQTDTMVTVKVGVIAANGDYSATCYKNPVYDTVKVLFQEKPARPQLKPTYTYLDGDSAHAAYCASEWHNGFTLKDTDFVAITGATISIVGYPTGIDTAGVYQVVANNNDYPNCPGDTLTLYVKEKRTPVVPAFDTVYYCSGTLASYTITKVDANDTIIYLDGTTPLAEQPNTAGVYTLHIVDKIDGCSKDSTLVIVEVPLPTATITTSPNWHNDTICEGTPINETYLFTITPHVQHTAIETFTWKDITSTTNTATLTATPTADTSVAFFYHLVDTAYNSFSKVGCAYDFDSTITYKFFETPELSLLTKDTAFCAGDTVVITSDFITLLTTGTELMPTPALPDTFAAATGTVVVYARYTGFTSCRSADSTITVTRNELPTVAIAPHGTTICYGDTATLKVTGATTYEWSTGATIDSIFAVDSIKYSVIGTDDNGCKNVDTVKVDFYPIFTVKVSNDTSVCVGSTAELTASADGGSGSFNFEWFKSDSYTSPATLEQTDNAVTTSTYTATPDSSIKINAVPVPSLYKVKVTDATYNCVSDSSKNVIAVAAVNGARIEFRQIGGTEAIRYMEIANTGDQSGFEMYIKDEGGCPCDSGAKVFIDFQIFKDGAPMTDSQLAFTLDDISGSNNTLYEFDMSNTVLNAIPFNSGYKTTQSYIPIAKNLEVMPGIVLDYDWVYMHFLLGESNGAGGHDGRKIKVTNGAWKSASEGVYTFAYAVVKAKSSNPGIPTEHPFSYNAGKILGGKNSHQSGVGMVYDTLVLDFFTVYVGTTYSGSASDFIYDVPSVVTPAVEEETVATAMDMKVYPNPASNNVNVVLEGISGQTLITVHDMSGKAVSSMRVDVDNDGQVFNLPVDNYSQGIYFVKAVNGNAVMTKKLIIAR